MKTMTSCTCKLDRCHTEFMYKCSHRNKIGHVLQGGGLTECFHHFFSFLKHFQPSKQLLNNKLHYNEHNVSYSHIWPISTV